MKKVATETFKFIKERFIVLLLFLKGRALSRAKSRRTLDYSDVLENLAQKGISIRVASPKLVMEEAPESYKNVTDVVNTCESFWLFMPLPPLTCFFLPWLHILGINDLKK